MTSKNKRLECADYHVAWICPLADVELPAARLMLDEEHDVPQFDTHYDENTYICGEINGHTVVVATCVLGETGNVNAGRLTGSMFKSFPNIRMAVLVGIGGGIPQSNISDDPLENIHLGDVIVGWPGDGKPACVYHDRGKSKVNGQHEMVGTMQDPDYRLTNALSVLISDHDMGQTKFRDQLARLQRLNKFAKKFAHPGLEHDRLFSAAYHHNGEDRSDCTTCNSDEIVKRPQRTEEHKKDLVFHRGRIATGDSVIRDGVVRDQIGARCDGALCVEMEAAGVDVNRECLVIRGISDYADSHKSDLWQYHAAGNAAAFTRELLCRIQPGIIKEMEGVKVEEVKEGPWLVPFVRSESFVGRKNELAQLSAHISSDGGQRFAVYGLGGCGKTALALEVAYRTREEQPTRAIFWVPAVSRERFEQAYLEIGTLLRIPGIETDNADVKQLVKAALSDESFGHWHMIIDNADDTNVLFDSLGQEDDSKRLIDFLPHSRKGSIVFTTRTREAAIKIAQRHIQLDELDKQEAKEVLRKTLLQKDLLEHDKFTDKFLEILTFLPLAIVQAVAFVNVNDISLSEYIDMFRNNERDATDLLSEEIEDQARYHEIKNAVATTWFISFEKIRQQDRLAAEYLSFMACTTGESIPETMLPPSSSRVKQTKATGRLKAYAFIKQRPQNDQIYASQKGTEIFDVHALVHLATRNWLRQKGEWYDWLKKTLMRLMEVIPYDPKGSPIEQWVWIAYLPHATHIVDFPEIYEAEAGMSLLGRIGDCENTIGHYKSAEMAYRQLIEKQEKLLGKEDPDTLTSMNNLAVNLTEQGSYAEAEKLQREELALREKIQDKEHPEHSTLLCSCTLARMNNLAEALMRQGSYASAEEIYREILVLREKIPLFYVRDHLDTLESISSLMGALESQGKKIEAMKIYREEIHRKIPALLWKALRKMDTNMPKNLAEALTRQESYATSEEMVQERLAPREKAPGKEHPNTLEVRKNLAGATLELVADDMALTEEIDRETQALSEKVQGKEHPDTLGMILEDHGGSTKSEEIHHEMLALTVQELGKKHPYTLTKMNNLALVRETEGRYGKAEELYREVLAMREEVLGKGHPDTRQTERGLNRTVSLQRRREQVKREQLALIHRG